MPNRVTPIMPVFYVLLRRLSGNRPLKRTGQAVGGAEPESSTVAGVQ
jgi:hypothetical protein